MNTLIELKATLLAKAKEIFPKLSESERRISPHFFRESDTERGDIVTDFAIELADLLKESPFSIAPRLLAELPQSERITTHTERGFINMRLSSPHDFSLEGVVPTRTVVVLPGLASGGNGWEALRVSSRALLHYLFLRAQKAECLLLIEDELIAADLMPPSALMRLVLERVAATVSRPLESGYSIEDLWVRAKRFPGWKSSLWLSSSQSKVLFQNDYAETMYRDDAQLVLNIPRKRWCDGVHDLPSLLSLMSWTERDLSNLFVYLASDIDGGDLDLVVPRSFEVANVSWNVRSTLQRLSGLAPFKGEQDSEGEASPLDRLVALFPLEIGHLAERGSFPTFYAGVSELLKRINFNLNSPSFRSRHANGVLTRQEAKIMSGAQRILSCTIERYPFF